jgi:hypothetical protein
MKPTSIEDSGSIQGRATKDFQDVMGDNELIKKLESNLSGEYREIYLKIKHGTKVNKSDIKKLQKFIEGILDE